MLGIDPGSLPPAYLSCNFVLTFIPISSISFFRTSDALSPTDPSFNSETLTTVTPLQVARHITAFTKELTMVLATSEGPSTLPLGLARRTLGIILLLVVVVLWTTSNFLGSVCAPCFKDIYTLKKQLVWMVG